MQLFCVVVGVAVQHVVLAGGALALQWGQPGERAPQGVSLQPGAERARRALPGGAALHRRDGQQAEGPPGPAAARLGQHAAPRARQPAGLSPDEQLLMWSYSVTVDSRSKHLMNNS